MLPSGIPETLKYIDDYNEGLRKDAHVQPTELEKKALDLYNSKVAKIARVAIPTLLFANNHADVNIHPQHLESSKTVTTIIESKSDEPQASQGFTFSKEPNNWSPDRSQYRS